MRLDVDVRIEARDGLARALHLRHADPRRVVRDLPLQVVERDGIVIDDADGADPGRRQIHEHRRAEPSRTDHQHARRLELLLSLAAHLAQHEMPLVTLDFFGGQGHAGIGCCCQFAWSPVYTYGRPVAQFSSPRLPSGAIAPDRDPPIATVNTVANPTSLTPSPAPSAWTGTASTSTRRQAGGGEHAVEVVDGVVPVVGLVEALREASSRPSQPGRSPICRLSRKTNRPPGFSTRAISAVTCRRTSGGSSWKRKIDVTMSTLASASGIFSPAASISSAPRRPLEMAARLVEIGPRQVEALQRHGRVGEPHLAQEAPRAAGDVEQRHLPLVASAHELGDRAQRRTAHRAGRAHEQRLHLHVVEPRRFLGEIAAGLEVEVLRVVVGHAGGGRLGLRRGGIVVGPARCRGVGQVGQHPPHAQEMADRRGRLVVHRRVEAVAHGQRIGSSGAAPGRPAAPASTARVAWACSGRVSPAGSVRQSTRRLQGEIPAEPQRLAGQLCRHAEIVCPRIAVAVACDRASPTLTRGFSSHIGATIAEFDGNLNAL